MHPTEKVRAKNEPSNLIKQRDFQRELNDLATFLPSRQCVSNRVMACLPPFSRRKHLSQIFVCMSHANLLNEQQIFEQTQEPLKYAKEDFLRFYRGLLKRAKRFFFLHVQQSIES